MFIIFNRDFLCVYLLSDFQAFSQRPLPSNTPILYYKHFNNGTQISLIYFKKTVGFLFSGPLSFLSNEICYYFSVLRIFGQLSAIAWNVVMMWVIRQLIQTQEDGKLIKELWNVYKDLEKQEGKLLIFCYICPVIIVLWPLFSGDIIKSQKNQYLFCYVYNTSSNDTLQTIVIILQKILIYDAAYIFYFCYSAIVLYKMKKVFNQTDHQINIEASQLIKQLIMFPIITFICSFGYTIQEILSIFIENGNLVFIIIQSLLISLWGLFYSIQFAYLIKIRERIRGSQLKNSQSMSVWEEYQLTLMQQSDTDSYYYSPKQDSLQQINSTKYEELIKMSQQNSKTQHLNDSRQIN